MPADAATDNDGDGDTNALSRSMLLGLPVGRQRAWKRAITHRREYTIESPHTMRFCSCLSRLSRGVCDCVVGVTLARSNALLKLYRCGKQGHVAP